MNKEKSMAINQFSSVTILKIIFMCLVRLEMFLYVHVCMHVYVSVHIYTYTHVHVFTCIYMYVYRYTGLRAYTLVYITVCLLESFSLHYLGLFVGSNYDG